VDTNEMVDTQSWLKAAKLIQDFKRGRITNDEFVAGFPNSPDTAIGAIRSMLWFCYDDLREHRLTGKWALTEEGERLFDRCILFLKTDFEYHGRANLGSIPASLDRFWRWVTRNPEPAIAPWWPFESQAQATDTEHPDAHSA
jgi:hypothetical protein